MKSILWQIVRILPTCFGSRGLPTTSARIVYNAYVDMIEREDPQVLGEKASIQNR